MRILITITLLGLLLPFSSEAQLFRKHKEQKADSLRNGVYYEYWDNDTSLLSARGHFCQGRPCKTWKYYHKHGKRRMKVKYRDKLKIKYYRDNGKLDQKGYAILDLDSEVIHFYWHGVWKYYDDKRKLYRIALYEKGEEVEVLKGPADPIYFE